MSGKPQQYHSGFVARLAQLTAWPHPSDLDVPSAISALHIFAKAPWFHPAGLREEGLVTSYVIAGYLPDRVPAIAVETPDWALRCCVPDTAIFRRRDNFGRRVSVVAARREFTRRI